MTTDKAAPNVTAINSNVRIQQEGEANITHVSDGRVVLSVPINIKRRSGRKQVTLPNGQVAKPDYWNRPLTPLQTALYRGYRWLELLESGAAQTLKEIAEREKVDTSYVSRMVNLTNLAPEIVAAILDDDLPDHITLFDLAVDPPPLWEDQRAKFGI